MSVHNWRAWWPFTGRAPSFAAPAPLRPLWVIGDVHGCDDLLGRMLRQILTQTPPGEADIIFMGDYIDRGPDSRQVLTRLQALSQRDGNVLCLFGNHEQMLCDFLDDPVGRGRSWLRHGGLQTLESYGVPLPGSYDRDKSLVATAARLREAMGAQTLSWLRRCPHQWRSGNVVVAHAGLDPARSVDAQLPGTLLWGHPAFLHTPRRDGIWVAHGHTIVDRPGSNGRGRIAVDTGAYATGRLTAVLITPSGDVTVFST